MYGLLKGLRVVEGAAFVAGPTCALHLAQMGAEVIRFDQIGGGPDFRRWPLTPAGDSLYWESLNKQKKSVALNLASPEGRELAVAIATAPGENGGLFVTNYPVEGFLSYEKLKARREDVICVRVMGWADGAPAMDYTVNAAIGIPMMTGPVDRPDPVNHVLPAWDLLGGAYGAFAMMAALHDRRATGRGREIRVPLSDLAATSLAHMGQLAEVLTTGADRPRLGNSLFGAFGRDFVCSDGRRLMVVAITPKQWKGLVAGLGLTDAVSALEAELSVDFARDEGARFTWRDRLFPHFERAFAARTSAELASALDAEGVTWGPYQSLHEAATTDARLFTANPVFQTLTHPSGKTYPASGPAGTLAGEPRGAITPAAKLGQHTDEVLAEVLGLSSAEIGRLHDAGTVAGPEGR